MPQTLYKPGDLHKAVDAVYSGQISSVRDSVPRSTLHDHVQGKEAFGAKSGAKLFFLQSLVKRWQETR